MNEEGDIPTEFEQSQQTLADGRKDEKSGLLSFFGKKDKKVAELTEKVHALELQNARHMKELDDVRGELDRYKLNTEKESAQMKDEIKSKSEENEKLKVANRKAETKSKSLISQLKLSSAEIKNLKESKLELQSRISQLEKGQSSMLATIYENLKATEMTIRETFVVSEITEERTYSQSTEFAGTEWMIYLFKKDDHLGFYVGMEEESDRSYAAVVDRQLISHKSEEIVYTNGTKQIHVYDNDDQSWGRSKFISLKDLFDEEKGYVKDDTIIVAAVIRAFPTN